MFALLVIATQLRGVVAAAWLGAAASPGLGMRGVMHVLTRALTVDLAVLVVASLAVFALAGRRRNLGRAFDLGCVAGLPLVLVDLVATTIVRTADVELPHGASFALTAAAFAWTGMLVALAVRPARTSLGLAVPAPPAGEVTRGRTAGWAMLAVAALGTAMQVTWLVENGSLLRPMTSGTEAPELALPSIGPGGALGAPVTLAQSRGKVTIVDFWATWCGPCLRSMPELDRVAVKHAADVTVIAVNLDDAKAARALWDEHGYHMQLVRDDGQVSDRYGVTTIPHTVLIDADGVVRGLHRDGKRLEAEIRDLQEQIRK